MYVGGDDDSGTATWNSFAIWGAPSWDYAHDLRPSVPPTRAPSPVPTPGDTREVEVELTLSTFAPEDVTEATVVNAIAAVLEGIEPSNVKHFSKTVYARRRLRDASTAPASSASSVRSASIATETASGASSASASASASASGGSGRRLQTMDVHVGVTGSLAALGFASGLELARFVASGLERAVADGSLNEALQSGCGGCPLSADAVSAELAVRPSPAPTHEPTRAPTHEPTHAPSHGSGYDDDGHHHKHGDDAPSSASAGLIGGLAAALVVCVALLGIVAFRAFGPQSKRSFAAGSGSGGSETMNPEGYFFFNGDERSASQARSSDPLGRDGHGGGGGMFRSPGGQAQGPSAVNRLLFGAYQPPPGQAGAAATGDAIELGSLAPSALSRAPASRLQPRGDGGEGAVIAELEAFLTEAGLEQFAGEKEPRALRSGHSRMCSSRLSFIRASSVLLPRSNSPYSSFLARRSRNWTLPRSACLAALTQGALVEFGIESVSDLCDVSLISDAELMDELGFRKVEVRKLRKAITLRRIADAGGAQAHADRAAAANDKAKSGGGLNLFGAARSADRYVDAAAEEQRADSKAAGRPFGGPAKAQAQTEAKAPVVAAAAPAAAPAAAVGAPAVAAGAALAAASSGYTPPDPSKTLEL